jgi:hypothetical protein
MNSAEGTLITCEFVFAELIVQLSENRNQQNVDLAYFVPFWDNIADCVFAVVNSLLCTSHDRNFPRDFGV